MRICVETVVVVVLSLLQRVPCVLMYSDPLVTKLDFDKEPTPGPKQYPPPDDLREPLVQDKGPNKEDVQVSVTADFA